MSRFFLLVVSLFLLATDSRATESTLTFERFGTVHLYSSSAAPTQVALFASGDGGWNQGVVDMARELANGDVVVAGIDITHYLKELAASDMKCAYPAADFEALSQFVQKSRELSCVRQAHPGRLFVGRDMVYATLVQAPSTTFKGALSLGFCPDLDLAKPFCKGSGIEFEPGAGGKGQFFAGENTARAMDRAAGRDRQGV